MRRISRHDETASAVLTRRHNGALFWVARTILGNDADAEGPLQEAYIAACLHLGSFRGDSKVLTWLTRIAVNRALARRRSGLRERTVVPLDERLDSTPDEGFDAITRTAKSPESEPIRADILRLLERKLDALQVALRMMFMLREVGELSAEETAACLSILEATVRTHLFRTRSLLRESPTRDLDLATGDVFSFRGERCSRVVAHVLARCRSLGLGPRPV